jgi:ATP-binding cassette, subfamily B, bacterial
MEKAKGKGIWTRQNRELLGTILSGLKPYRGMIFLLVCSILASSVITMALPYLSKMIVDDGLMGGSLETIIRWTAVTLALVLADQGIGLLGTGFLARIHALFGYSLSARAFRQILRLKIQYFQNANTMSLFNNLGVDTMYISSLADRPTFYVAAQVFKLAGGIIGLMFINWKLSLIVLLFAPVRAILIKHLAGRRLRLAEKGIAANGEYAGWLGDTLSGIKEVKAWNLGGRKFRQFTAKQREMVTLGIRSQFVERYNEISETLLVNVLTAILYVAGGLLVLRREFTMGGLMAFLTYSMYVANPISAILNMGFLFANIFPSARRFFAFLGLEREPEGKGTGSAAVPDPDSVAEISFENVSFFHERSPGRPVLDNVSFTVRKGEKVAIVGSNGSGKTTLAYLLLRLYEPAKGRILLNGTDIREFNLKGYRSLISFVSQDLYLFDETIRQNILLSDKTGNGELSAALAGSGASGFVAGLPDGTETRVAANGAGFSGGQRRKLGVARAFARDCGIFVFDEAMSGLDRESEEYLHGLLAGGLGGKTALIISHKPDIGRYVDRVFRLSDGSLNEGAETGEGPERVRGPVEAAV